MQRAGVCGGGSGEWGVGGMGMTHHQLGEAHTCLMGCPIHGSPPLPRQAPTLCTMVDGMGRKAPIISQHPHMDAAGILSITPQLRTQTNLNQQR